MRAEFSLLLIFGTTIVVVWGAEATKQAEICTAKVAAKVCQDGIAVMAEGRGSDGRKNQSRRTIRIHIPGKKHMARASG